MLHPAVIDAAVLLPVGAKGDVLVEEIGDLGAGIVHRAGLGGDELAGPASAVGFYFHICVCFRRSGARAVKVKGLGKFFVAQVFCTKRLSAGGRKGLFPLQGGARGVRGGGSGDVVLVAGLVFAAAGAGLVGEAVGCGVRAPEIGAPEPVVVGAGVGEPEFEAHLAAGDDVVFAADAWMHDVEFEGGGGFAGVGS